MTSTSGSMTCGGDMDLRFGEPREELMADLVVRSVERGLMADG